MRRRHIATEADGTNHGPLACPSHVLALASRRTAHGFTLIEILIVMAILAILAALSLSQYWMLRDRFFNSIALSDVVNAGKALDLLDGTATFSETVTGPTTIPDVPGPVVSTGTTLFVRRTQTSSGYLSYARASHRNGTATYFYENGMVSATLETF